MSDIKTTQDYEISLFEIINIVWQNKILIFVIFLFSILSGYIYYNSKNYIYHESKLYYTTYALPPFYSNETARIVALEDFQNFFFSEKLFNKWKKKGNSSLVFSDINSTQDIDGLIFRSLGERLVQLSTEEDSLSKKTIEGFAFINVKTNKLKLLDDIYNYSTFINNALTSEYVTRAKYELNLLETRIIGNGNINSFEGALTLDRYISSIDTGRKAFYINRPEIPKINPSLRLDLILVISGLIGVIIAILLALVISAIKKSNKIKN